MLLLGILLTGCGTTSELSSKQQKEINVSLSNVIKETTKAELQAAEVTKPPDDCKLQEFVSILENENPEAVIKKYDKALYNANSRISRCYKLQLEIYLSRKRKVTK